MRNSHLNLDCYKGQSLTNKIMRMWIHRRVIENLILDPGLVGSQCSRELAFLIDKFKDEYGDFTNK